MKKYTKQQFKISDCKRFLGLVDFVIIKETSFRQKRRRCWFWTGPQLFIGMDPKVFALVNFRSETMYQDTRLRRRCVHLNCVNPWHYEPVIRRYEIESGIWGDFKVPKGFLKMFEESLQFKGEHIISNPPFKSIPAIKMMMWLKDVPIPPDTIFEQICDHPNCCTFSHYKIFQSKFSTAELDHQNRFGIGW